MAGEVAAGARVAADYVKPYAVAAKPILDSAATQGVKLAEPLLSRAATSLKAAGVDVVPVVKGAGGVVSSLYSGLASPDAVTALGLGAFALLVVPTLLPAVAGLLRGYTGDLSPVQALDLIARDNALLVDLRRSPAQLPVLAKDKLANVEFDAIADRALRSSLSDPSDVEAESTARLIAALKKSSKRRPTILLDASGSQSRAVARKLSSLGFSRCYVVSGGFGAWQSSGLAVNSTLAR